MTKQRQLLEFPADALDIIGRMERITSAISEKEDLAGLVADLKVMSDDARHRVLKKEDINWESWFLSAGSLILGILSNYKFDKLHFAKFLIDKHRMYGMEPLLVWKELGILVRLTSKLSRFLNLINGEEGITVEEEASYDTIRDMLGYTILGCKLCQYLLIQRIEEDSPAPDKA